MGLDITAYSNLTRIGQHEKNPALNEGEPGGLTDWCFYDSHVDAFAYDTFLASFRGIPVLGVDRQFVKGGCYEITDKTKTHRFCAGSYSGYNLWRDHLREQFNPDTHPDGPFYELIWFADNEGCVGPDAARDLLADFRACASTYRPPAEYPWMAEKYEAWMRAFELAADGGLVRFH